MNAANVSVSKVAVTAKRGVGQRLRGGPLTSIAVALIVAIGGAATALAWSFARDGELRDSRAVVVEQARAKSNEVQGVLALIQEAVYGVGSNLAADGDAKNFEAFAGTILARHDSIAAIGWIEVASAAAGSGPVNYRGRDITARDWLGNFVPIEPKPRYLALTQMVVGQKAAARAQAFNAFLGFDFSSDEQWLAPLERAQKASSIQISHVGMSGTDSLVFLPVRRSTNAARGDDAITGYVVASVTLQQLIGRSMFADSASLVNRVFDASDSSGLKMIFPAANAATPAAADVTSDERDLRRALQQRQPVQVLGNQWLIETEPTVGFLRERGTWLPSLVLGMGGLLTLLMAAYVAALRNGKVKVERQVAERTTELNKANNELRDAEMMAMQSEKMSSLGQMVAGVAHEINTPLGFVGSNLQMLKDLVEQALPALQRQLKLMDWLPRWNTLTDDQKSLWYRTAMNNKDVLDGLQQSGTLDDGTALVDESLIGLERISEIVVTLKDFSRVDRAQVAAVDIHHCIDSTLIIAHNVIKQKAQVIKQYGQLPAVSCSPSQINQVILNLVTNAAQAIEQVGHIWIATRHAGASIEIDVRDDGPGIPTEIQPRLFEPFFTTKDVGKGTGLGLSICERIIRSHGGAISFVSAPGQGTTFTIRLPVKGNAEITAKRVADEPAFA